MYEALDTVALLAASRPDPAGREWQVAAGPQSQRLRAFPDITHERYSVYQDVRGACTYGKETHASPNSPAYRRGARHDTAGPQQCGNTCGNKCQTHS